MSTVVGRRRVLDVELGALLLALALLPHRLVGDDTVRTVALSQIADGVMPRTKYSLIQPFFSAPFFSLLTPTFSEEAAVHLISMLWLTAWAVLVRRRLATLRSPAEATTTVLLSVVSLMAAYVVGFNAEVWTVLLVSGGLLHAWTSPRLPVRIAGWMAVVIGTANTPVLAAGLLAALVSLSMARRQVRHLAIAAAVPVVVAVEASIAEPGWHLTKYATDVEHGAVAALPWGDIAGFGWPLWSGVLAVLLSFGRGLVFFLPLALNGPSRQRDPVAELERALWWATVALVPVYATWWAWYGGVSYGPRFFMIGVIPAAMATARHLTDDRPLLPGRAAVLLATLMGTGWVAITGAVWGVTDIAFSVCTADGFVREHLCWYTPEYSSFFAPFWAADPVGVRDLAFVVVVGAVVATLGVVPARALAGAMRATWERRRAEQESAPRWRW